MRTICVLGMIVFAACGAFGQSPAAPSAFEVASVKPSKAEEGHSSWTSRLGNLDMHNVTLRTVILAAYEIKGYQLVGPDWLDTERFDIAAKASSVTQDDQLPPLMQALLAERFHLAVHRETKSMPAYALVVAKNGLKIHAAEPGRSSSNSRRGADGVFHLTAQKVSLARLAEQLFRMLDRPVVDQTGVAGVFDFTLDWVMESRPTLPSGADEERRVPAGNPDGSSIFTALQEQLGLRLQPDKAAVEILVVDHCDRVPIEN